MAILTFHGCANQRSTAEFVDFWEIGKRAEKIYYEQDFFKQKYRQMELNELAQRIYTVIARFRLIFW